MALVTLDEVRAARVLLEGIARTTPMISSRVLSERLGGEVLLKCENLQRTGSFKIRGAYVRIARLDAETRARGVVAASAGNHAQGVALAARELGTTATIVMPVGAPLPKVTATTAYGAQVRLEGATVDESLRIAQDLAATTGATFIHPFDHPDVIAGQGSVGLELLEQCPDVRTVLVCTGGGGLVSGIAAAVKALRPDVEVVAVQAAGAASWPGSLAAGAPVALGEMRTMADGIAVGRPGEITYEHVSALVDRVVTVSDEALARALVLCLERAKLVVEPAGAAAVAAVNERPEDFEPPVVAVVSGGNVDPLLLGKVIRFGLVAAGRYPTLRVRIGDNPGSLDALAATGATVLDVEHLRTEHELALEDVQVSLQLETRGDEHSAAVERALRTRGYVVG
jgi:threonine dehydratase